MNFTNKSFEKSCESQPTQNFVAVLPCAQGWECAALLGDGMMVRPAAGVWPESWQLVSDSWQRAVFESTGIRVKIAFKSLDGQRADAWALALRRCNSDPRVAVAQ